MWVGGTEITADRAASAHRLGLRFVHQGLGLIDELNAVDSFGIVSGFARTAARRVDWGAQAERVRAQLARFGVEVDLMRPVGELDAVERTAIAITRALEGLEPGSGALVLDEPTVALTEREVGRLFDTLREVQPSGVSVLYVSHHLDEVFAIADRVSILKGGRLVATRHTASLDRDELVQLMVGRDVGTLHGRRGSGQSAASSTPALRVRNLAGKQLDGIDFDVAVSEVLGIAGLQGSGIGECPYALVGASRHPGAMIEINGAGTPRPSPSAMAELGVRLIPRDRRTQGAIGDFNVRENMTLGNLKSLSRSGRMRVRDERVFVDHWIEELELLGKWLGVDPKVLVLDEPTNGVDIGAREKIYSTIRDQAAGGLAFVVCSSDAAVGVGNVCHIVEPFDLVHGLPAVAGHYERTLAAQRIGEGPPEAAGRAGHHGDLAVENLAHGSSVAAVPPPRFNRYRPVDTSLVASSCASSPVGSRASSLAVLWARSASSRSTPSASRSSQSPLCHVTPNISSASVATMGQPAGLVGTAPLLPIGMPTCRRRLVSRKAPSVRIAWARQAAACNATLEPNAAPMPASQPTSTTAPGAIAARSATKLEGGRAPVAGRWRRNRVTLPATAAPGGRTCDGGEGTMTVRPNSSERPAAPFSIMAQRRTRSTAASSSSTIEPSFPPIKSRTPFYGTYVGRGPSRRRAAALAQPERVS